jgi:uroporphyrinogen-III synthase
VGVGEYEESEGLYSYSEKLLSRLRATPYVHEIYEYRGRNRGFLGVYGFEVDPVPKYHLGRSIAFIKSVLFGLPSFSDVDWLAAATGEAVIQARVGQGRFREDLEKLWGEKCAVTGVPTRELLRASHIKPWAYSTVKQKLDPENGLLLSANLDALFDKYLISFDSDGRMLVSTRIESETLSVIPKEAKLRKTPSQRTKECLNKHRKKFDSIDKRS